MKLGCSITVQSVSVRVRGGTWGEGFGHTCHAKLQSVGVAHHKPTSVVTL